MADYYEVLGVSRQATAAEVRQAYVRLAKERHPDRYSDAVEKERAQEFFKDLTAAFNTLSNERNRREYDAELARPKFTTPEEIAQNAFKRGLERMQARDYHEAVHLFRTAAQHVSGDARYHVALGRALAKNPHWVREAISSFETALKIEPRNAAFHAELAQVLHGQGLRIRASRLAEAALRLAPGDPEVQRVAAEVGLPETSPEDKGGLLGRLKRKS